LAKEARKEAVVVAQEKPAIVPPAVRRDELGQDVELTLARPLLDGAASSVHRPLYSPLAHLLSEVLRLEEVEPELLVGLDPQVPLANGRENYGLQDGVGGEMMELHLVMRDGPHELAWRCPEPPLVEGDEAHHIALWWRRHILHFGRSRLILGRRRPSPTSSCSFFSITEEWIHASTGRT
jgi:hypothetical protein